MKLEIAGLSSYGRFFLIGLLALVLMMGCEEKVTEPNHSPIISSITISPESPSFGDTLSLSAVATDEDGDQLSYSWSEANGMGQFLSTNESSVKWIANFAVAANAIFEVSVSDGELTAKGSNAVMVSSADTPEFYYVGSSTCGQCHEEEYAEVMASGHPYKFSFVKNGQAPSYPDVVEAARTLPLPSGASSWDDILGVIGGFGWKARYVDKTGNIVGTANSVINAGGGQNQYNFYGGADSWADYHASDVKEYNYGCFRCHTTGATETGEWLSGIQGTFVYGGVQCERCHGPGSKHAEANAAIYIDHPEGNDITELCGQCHYRNEDHSVATKGGYIKHHEQYDEFIHTKHYDAGQNCATCHDPHSRVIWDGDGIVTECTSCHGSKTVASPHTSLDCDKCHMAKVAKSAVKTVEGYQGDIHSHTFAIAADSTWDMFSDDGKTLRLDADGHTKLTLANVCYGCHTDASGGGGGGSTKTLEDLVNYVASIHP